MFKKNKQYRKYIFAALCVLFAIWYCTCLPKQLFDAPVSLVVEDKNGELLGAHVATDHQWRFPYTKEVNSKFKKALITFEDKRFYKHLGVDILAIGRAMLSNISSGKVVSGASTISMQVMRLSGKNPKRTIINKIIEIFRTTRLEMRYDKNEILAFYASHAPFGGNVVGLDAASWKYFGKSQDKLTWSEATMLAVLPNAPSLIHPGKNRDLLLKKRNRLLDKLHNENHIDSITTVLAKLEPLPKKPLHIPSYTPHLVARFLNQNKTAKIKTSVDFYTQQAVANIIEKHHDYLSSKIINNASALVIDTKTGKVLSYVGNTDSKKEKHNNQVDMIGAKRSTGSILKPLLYAEMLDKGMILPNSIISDVPVNYQGYSPRNFNLTYDGVVPASKMVSRSLNIPAVNMLQEYGVNRFTKKLKSFGFNSIQKSGNHYGLPLILGGAEVSPWELGVVYTGLVQKLMGYNQNISVLQKDSFSHSYMKSYPSKMAIYQMFEAMLEVSRPNENKSWKVFENRHKIAWKTGTSFGGRDAWAVGCNPDYVVVVWAGNSSGEGRSDLTGFNTASPILFDVFNVLPKNNSWFKEPTDKKTEIVVCDKSGYKANQFCEVTSKEVISIKGRDSKPCGYCQSIALDVTEKVSVNGSNYAPLDRVEKTYFVLNPAESFYYKKHHADYVDVPPSINNSQNFKVMYPKEKTKIYLPKLNKNTRSDVVFKALSDEKSDELFWTLDDEFIGVTTENHYVTVQPSKGKHILLVVNKNGKRKVINFEVEI